MAVAGDIIKDALKEIGILGEAETPSAEMSQDALRALNRLLERWSNSRQYAFAETQLSYALTGAASFTIGPTGNLVAARPIQLLAAYSDNGGVSYDCRILTARQYDAITVKTLAGGPPDALYYEATMPNGTVYVYPQAAAYTLKMRVLTVIRSFAGLTTEASLPPGYEESLVLQLAIRLAPQYRVRVSEDTRRDAAIAMKALKRVNLQLPTLGVEISRRGGDSRSYFLSGGQ